MDAKVIQTLQEVQSIVRHQEASETAEIKKKRLLDAESFDTQEYSSSPLTRPTFTLQALEKVAPVLTKTISDAIEGGDQDTSFHHGDKRAFPPNNVVIDLDRQNATFSQNNHHTHGAAKFDLILGAPLLRNLGKAGVTIEELQALIEHELGHGEIIFSSQSQLHAPEVTGRPDPHFEHSRANELMADRNASSEIAMIGLLLRVSKIDSSKYYSANSSDLTHANDRERIVALLQEAYHNEYAGDAGYFNGQGKDYEFHPMLDENDLPAHYKHSPFAKQSPEMPYTQIVKAADARIASDMMLIDEQVKRGLPNIDLLKQYLTHRIERFNPHDVSGNETKVSIIEQQQHAALASRFLFGSNSQDLILHYGDKDKLASANIALDMMDKNLSTLQLSEVDKQLTQLQTKLNIADNLHRGNHPHILVSATEERQSNTVM